MLGSPVGQWCNSKYFLTDLSKAVLEEGFVKGCMQCVIANCNNKSFIGFVSESGEGKRFFFLKLVLFSRKRSLLFLYGSKSRVMGETLLPSEATGMWQRA